MDGPKLPDPNDKVQRVISVSDLIEMCIEAENKMSVTNPNKLLMKNVAYALTQLVDRLAKYESSVN